MTYRPAMPGSVDAALLALVEGALERFRGELLEAVRAEVRQALAGNGVPPSGERPSKPPASPPDRARSTDPKRLVGVAELEERLNVDRRSVARWCRAGTFPAPLYLAGRKVWHLQVVEAWEAANVQREPPASARNLRKGPARGAP